MVRQPFLSATTNNKNGKQSGYMRKVSCCYDNCCYVGVSQSLNEKVTGLCEACQLTQNSLFLLPYSDRIMVYILKYDVIMM